MTYVTPDASAFAAPGVGVMPDNEPVHQHGRPAASTTAPGCR